MINGAHVVIYSKNPESDRTFFRDVLQFPSVDAGHGWLIFGMPPLLSMKQRGTIGMSYT